MQRKFSDLGHGPVLSISARPEAGVPVLQESPDPAEATTQLCEATVVSSASANPMVLFTNEGVSARRKEWNHNLPDGKAVVRPEVLMMCAR